MSAGKLHYNARLGKTIRIAGLASAVLCLMRRPLLNA